MHEVREEFAKPCLHIILLQECLQVRPSGKADARKEPHLLVWNREIACNARAVRSVLHTALNFLLKSLGPGHHETCVYIAP